jgi:hypothetical protein
MDAELLREFRDSLRDRLDQQNVFAGGTDGAGLFMNPGFTTRFGIELEFLCNKDRFHVGNSVNTCILHQNDPFWRSNFEVLRPTPAQRAEFRAGISGPKPITATPNKDEWSSFMMEVTLKHGSTTFRGAKKSSNEGVSGSKIEDDSSVRLNEYVNEIMVFTKQPEADYLPSVAKDGYIYRATEMLNGPAGTDYRFFETNEFVSSVLTNEPILYPKVLQADGSYKEGYIPYGFLVIDNTMQHMLSHNNKIVVQDMGFHVHLSEYPRIQDVTERMNRIMGFVKLFYLFEPLLFACQPAYRGRSKYCKPLQSVFSLYNMMSVDPRELYRWMTGGRNKIWGTHRSNRVDSARYLALNLFNCKPKGSGTVEVRLAHATFDSHYLNHFIHMLQNLFELSMAMSEEKINALLEMAQAQEMFPAWVIERESYYEDDRMYSESDFYAFSNPSYTTSAERSRIPQKLLQLYYCLTGCQDTVYAMVPYMNYYHATAENKRLGHVKMFSADLMTPLPDAEVILAACDRYLDAPEWNRNRLTSASYLRGEALEHECENCVKIQDQCAKGADTIKSIVREQHIQDERIRIQSLIEQGILSDAEIRGLMGSIGNPTGELDEHYEHRTQAELILGKGQMGGRARRATRKGLHRRYVPAGHVKTRKGLKPTRRSLKTRRGLIMQTRRGGRVVAPAVPAVPAMPAVSMKSPAGPAKQDFYDMLYRVNKGAPKLVMEWNGKSWEVFDTDWLGARMPEPTLTPIVNALLKVITLKQLRTLERGQYLDAPVFLTSTELHQRALLKELGALGFDADTVARIRAVYANAMVPRR